MDCKHENLQMVVTNSWIKGRRLYSVRCLDCNAMTEPCFTVGEARTRLRLGIFGYVEKEEK